MDFDDEDCARLKILGNKPRITDMIDSGISLILRESAYAVRKVSAKKKATQRWPRKHARFEVEHA